jgi:regulatory protein
VVFVIGRGSDAVVFVFMATVTELTFQKKNTDRINVFLDGEFAFGLSAFVGAGLRVGQQLTEAEIESLKQSELQEKAKQNAFKLVGLRPRSEYEIRTHLRRKAYTEAVIDSVIERLIDLEFLNDYDFAKYWVEQRETFRPRSRFALSQELRQKGIDREIIEAVLEDVDESNAARRAAEAKTSSWSALPEQDFKEKMAGFLRRRGFSYEIINETIDAAWQTIERAEG